MADPGAEAQSWRSDQIAIAAAAMSIFTPIAFLVFGWIAGGASAALAAALCVVVYVLARIERAECREKEGVAEQEAENERQAKARFLSILSHDLRQPIHALSLYTAALSKRVETDEARGILDKIDRAAQSSAELISRIDAYARLSAQTLEPHLEVCALQPILEEVEKNYPAVAVTQTSLKVHTDAKLLGVALERLADNAVRYGGGGCIEALEDGDDVDISVTDCGQGIPEEEHARIFDEFVRLEGARNSEGLGLGLPIARRIAKVLNTDVRVESAPNEGARFSVRVPIAR